ncbi:MAG: pyruvate, water dikinase [Parcubacteria group bacterium Gr01-1014_107]|nr:MAG: pyruvate, water dikinase [Parcubacteria group bacterium Gr01-1014_107]
MTSEQIKDRVLQYKWEHWADRPFGAFILSFFKEGQTRAYIKKTGVDAEWPALLYQKGAYYKSEEVWDIFAEQVEAYLNQGGNVFDIVSKCDKYLDFGRDTIEKIIISTDSLTQKLERLHETFAGIISYVWLAHGFEHIYVKKLRAEVPKYFEGETESVIGDISFPIKKNAHYYFEEALRGNTPIEEVEKKFTWIKSRDGFSPGFTLSELEAERTRLKKQSQHSEDFVRPQIPEEIQELVRIAQELVYFRTLRTDILFELLYLSRPILFEVAKKYALAFEELRDYSIDDLISGKLEYYRYGDFSAISIGRHFTMVHGFVFADKKIESVSEFKGVIAFRGKIQGIAKIVMTAYEAEKVNAGDILIAPATAPSYIMVMKRAAAFVTDEGGITSHTAIVSREMKKPCIIGTKIATKVLKDGDLVEVDAERGIITILKKS